MRTGRVVGLDVARCLALIGMVAVHVLPERAPDGDLTVTHWLAGGRASALFAVLAGVTLALLTDRRRGRVRDLAAIAVRALLVALIGLALGGLDSGLAVILTYYGVLFLLGLPFVTLGARALLIFAAGWAVVAPVVSHLVRPRLAPRTFDVPSFASLADPGGLLSDLLLTGYYPALPWLTYLVAGMAVGRLDLRSRVIATRLLLGGLVAAVVATAVSAALLSVPALRDPLVGGAIPGANADEVLGNAAGGLAGVTPTDGPWQWLLVVAPHSATPFDLVQTTGSALAVIGLCLLVVGALRGRTLHGVAVLFGAGTMTLTLYSLHVLLRTETLWPPDHGPDAFRWHVMVVLSVGALFVAVDAPGPLEWLVRRVTRAVARR